MTRKVAAKKGKTVKEKKPPQKFTTILIRDLTPECSEYLEKLGTSYGKKSASQIILRSLQELDYITKRLDELTEEHRELNVKYLHSLKTINKIKEIESMQSELVKDIKEIGEFHVDGINIVKCEKCGATGVNHNPDMYWYICTTCEHEQSTN